MQVDDSHQMNHAWVPHRFCVSDDPMVIWLHVLGDGGTAIAYALIPMALLWTSWNYRGTQTKELRDILLHAGAFIVCCGSTHALQVVSWWKPIYLLSGFVNLLTAIVSLTFVFRAWRFLKGHPLHSTKQ